MTPPNTFAHCILPIFAHTLSPKSPLSFTAKRMRTRAALGAALPHTTQALYFDYNGTTPVFPEVHSSAHALRNGTQAQGALHRTVPLGVRSPRLWNRSWDSASATPPAATSMAGRCAGMLSFKPLSCAYKANADATQS